MASHSAFTTTYAQQSMVHPMQTMSQPPRESRPTPTRKTEWPESVRRYVQRAFAPEYALPGVERSEMESKLKEVISGAAENETLYEVNWDAFPLPQQLIQKEQARHLGIATRTWQEATQPPSHESHKVNNKSSKKRKSSELSKDNPDGDTQPPWRKANNRNVFEDRITYASPNQAEQVDKRQRRKIEKESFKVSSKYQVNLEKRRERFELGKTGDRSPPWSRAREQSSPTPNMNDGPVVGTSEKIEKNYLRLTAPPKPETVRPLAVLRKTLEHLKLKWKSDRDYSYICDQFKSLRQDLTVQHIKNEFTVDVYEIHARIALEKADLGEYNQCQTQLRALYSQGLGGHPAEYLAYRILYFIHTCNRTGMNDVLADLTTADKAEPAVKHALDVRSALALGNYHKFFRLYLATPNMGAYLMDMFATRERLSAFANICRAYKTVKLRFLTEELAFESDRDCAHFLDEYGAFNLLEQRETDDYVFQCGQAMEIFEQAKRSAFKRVDIKGQI